jgi:hypothetical protein
MKPTKDGVIAIFLNLDDRSKKLLQAMCDLFMNSKYSGDVVMQGMRWRYAIAQFLGFDNWLEDAFILTDEVLMAIRDYGDKSSRLPC